MHKLYIYQHIVFLFLIDLTFGNNSEGQGLLHFSSLFRITMKSISELNRFRPLNMVNSLNEKLKEPMLNPSIDRLDFVFNFLCVLFIINTLKSLFFNQIDRCKGWFEIQRDDYWTIFAPYFILKPRIYSNSYYF